MMVEDARLLHDAIYEVIQENLLALDLSRLITDLRRMDDCIDAGLKESLRAYVEESELAATAKRKSEPARVAKASSRKKAAS
jgi:hypothetical protein